MSNDSTSQQRETERLQYLERQMARLLEAIKQHGNNDRLQRIAGHIAQPKR